MKFLIQQIANRDNCLCDGYAQGFEAYQIDNSQACEDGYKFCGAYYESGFDDRAVLVQTKFVEADSPYMAIQIFRDWLMNGLDDKYLKAEGKL